MVYHDPVDPDTDDASIPRRRCPECIRRANLPRAQRRTAQHQSAGVTTTPTSTSSLRTVAELKAKYGPTLQVDGVVEGNYDDGTVDATNTLQSSASRSWGARLGRKGKGRRQKLSSCRSVPLHRRRIGRSLGQVWNPRLSGRRKGRAYGVGGPRLVGYCSSRSLSRLYN